MVSWSSIKHGFRSAASWTEHTAEHTVGSLFKTAKHGGEAVTLAAQSLAKSKPAKFVVKEAETFGKSGLDLAHATVDTVVASQKVLLQLLVVQVNWGHVLKKVLVMPQQGWATFYKMVPAGGLWEEVLF